MAWDVEDLSSVPALPQASFLRDGGQFFFNMVDPPHCITHLAKIGIFLQALFFESSDYPGISAVIKHTHTRTNTHACTRTFLALKGGDI